MLILSRKEGEWIRLGDNIQVHVLSIRGGAVRLGFMAPNEVAIYRSELLDRDGRPLPKPEKGP